MYFGKLALFVALSIFQAIVTIIFSFAIGIHVDNLGMFIFTSIFVSVIFMVLIYSFVSAVGQVGKMIAILLLVFQISGTGGIYPIEIMNPIFQALYPYLPMTYAINIVRETVLGLIWSNYIPSFLVLMAIAIATIILSLIIKEKADKASHFFEEKLEDSGLF
jgi:putative membrane protein